MQFQIYGIKKYRGKIHIQDLRDKRIELENFIILANAQTIIPSLKKITNCG